MRAVIFVIIALSLSGCKETHCPAFPTNLVEYFPYTNGDELKFMNTNNDTLILKIVKNWSSDSYSFDWNCKCSCGADAGFVTEIDSSFSIEINGTIDVSNDTKVSIINCTLSDGKISSDNFYYRVDGINPFIEESISLFGDTINFNNEEYYRFNNILIIKSKGIIKFWDKKQNCEWIMVE